MANITSIKIPELSELSQEEFTGAEYLVLDTGTATKKMQVSDFNRASTETATAKANASAQSATDAAESALNAQNAAQSATDAIANARAQITQDVIDARNAKSNAESYANTARNLVNSDYALTSRSYATGDAVDALGHEYREGQSTDNAKYYAEQAKESETNAALSVNDAKNHKLEAESAKAAANNFKETAREYAIQAKESAQQAQENAAGATVFTADTDGLVPASGENTEGFLKGNREWVNLHEHRMLDCSCVADRLYKTTGDRASGAISKGDIVCAYDPDDSNHTGARIYEAQGDFANGESLSITASGGFNLVTIPSLLNQMKTSFQDGVDTIKNAFIAKGVTPSASTPSALATAVDTAYETGRSLGDSEGYTRGHAQGLEDGQHIVKLGSGTSYNVSSYKGYENFTKDNFIVKIKSVSISNQMSQSSHNSGMGMSAPGTASNTVTPSVNYNASTATVTIGNLSGTCNNKYEPTATITASSNVTVTASIDVYLVY